MPDNILVALDGSPLAERALIYALETFPNATITTIYVINPIDSVIDVEAGGLPVAEDWYDTAQERATEIHTTATDLAADHDIVLATVTEVGKPAREILDYAADNGIDQIVMGSHGRSGLDRTFLGSVAETVTRRAQIPVTIIG
ncbi:MULTISPECIES: universal stress protein [Halobacteriales]|jgi:nucleotide-binding universal stress UspA family protein|uniref:Nucleotide-binding universal stress protein, UspA family n=2 Tax=Halobacteriales TaxID=2235 RepID=A0A521ETQ8_9EURY|nr:MULTISPECIES: universal stress protein [Halobacteria]TKX76863.1 universal stress protein [Halorubrum sp. SD626R]RDZ32085.1 universal stress protein UspA [Haloferax sp. Atlit-24N]RLM33247.1 universal stress protein [Haloferax sp. Atlit-109R]RLM40715.1 universal stress protein [Haloferax sp. Atlit-105R]RLM62845.1 universal stress protein [Halorubrum sp. Atlit-9R]